MKPVQLDYTVMLSFIAISGIFLAVSMVQTNNSTLFQYCYAIYRNSRLYLFYTLFVCGLICLGGRIVSDMFFGRLNETNQSSYNEIAADYLGSISMTGVSFPYTLQVFNMAPFTLFYQIKGMSWVFMLNSESMDRDSNFNTFKYFFVAALAMVLFIVYKLHMLCNKFALLFMSFNGLLAFEYFLTLFLFVKQMLLNYFSSATPGVEFGIKAFYLMSRIGVISFYANNLSKFRVPITYLKMIITDIAELKKISIVFYKYLKLCKELEKVEDATVESQTCAICTDDLTKGKKLKCGHIFHTDCLKTWCQREVTCPICRKALTFKKEITIETDTEIIRAARVE